MQNVQIYKETLGRTNKTCPAFKKSELPKLIGKIEQIPIKEKVGWQSDVKRLLDQIDDGKAEDDAEQPLLREGMQVQETPFLVFDGPSMMWEQVKFKIETQKLVGSWYCITGKEREVSYLTTKLCEEVIRNGSILHLADFYGVVAGTPAAQFHAA